MNDNINEEKQEQPTDHHIKKFRKTGKTKYSRELNSLLILLFGFLILFWYKKNIIWNLKIIMFESFSFNFEIISNSLNIFSKFFIFFKNIFLSFFPFFICIIIIILAPSIIFSGINFNFISLKFNFSKLNPVLGLKNIFSIQIFTEMFKMILKLFFIVIISFFYFWMHLNEILTLILEKPYIALFHGCNILVIVYFIVLLSLIPIVFFDVIIQEFRYHKKLKMSHKEIKDENKEVEGNPNTKMRIRQQMRSILQKRMISNMQKADVIITNPMHYAIALEYDEKNMYAPKVIAKGAGELAIKIKNLGSKYNISIISAPSLARSLYRYAEIGQYIPGPLYKAVAEVLSWVWKVRQWKKEGGIFPQKPKNILVPEKFHFKGKNNE